MYTSNTLRQQFTDSALETASGPRIVVMCFDRLDRDLGEAITALGESDHYRAHTALCHAQDIVHELLHGGCQPLRIAYKCQIPNEPYDSP